MSVCAQRKDTKDDEQERLVNQCLLTGGCGSQAPLLSQRLGDKGLSLMILKGWLSGPQEGHFWVIEDTSQRCREKIENCKFSKVNDPNKGSQEPLVRF